MSSDPKNFVKSTADGIKKIKEENYAFLLESTTNDYMKQRDCDLIQIGGLLDTKGYGKLKHHDCIYQIPTNRVFKHRNSDPDWISLAR